MDSQILNNVDCYFVDSAFRIDVSLPSLSLVIANVKSLKKTVSHWTEAILAHQDE